MELVLRGRRQSIPATVLVHEHQRAIALSDSRYIGVYRSARSKRKVVEVEDNTLALTCLEDAAIAQVANALDVRATRDPINKVDRVSRVDGVALRYGDRDAFVWPNVNGTDSISGCIGGKSSQSGQANFQKRRHDEILGRWKTDADDCWLLVA